MDKNKVVHLVEEYDNDYIADVYVIKLSKEEVEKTGAYLTPSGYGELRYRKERLNEKEEISIGVAYGDGKICSFAPLTKSDFTREEFDNVIDIVQDRMEDMIQGFKLDKEAFNDIYEEKEENAQEGDFDINI